MKPGLSSYTYTWACGVPGHDPEHPLGAVGVCRRALELGVEVVQLCENVVITPDIREELAEFPLTIEIGTRGLMGPFLEEAYRLAERLRSPVVRLVIDRDGFEPAVDEAIARLRPWADRAAATGIPLAIENHDRFSAATVARLCHELGPDHVGVALDTANSFGALEGPEVVIDTLASHVLSLHVKDFTIRRLPSQMGFVIEGCAVGDGRLDVPAILRRIRAAGRHPNAIIELWTPFTTSLERTIEIEAAWAEKSLASLRHLLPD